MMPWSPQWETGPDEKVGLSFCYGWSNVIFPEAGVYTYRLKIDGRELGTAKLLLALRSADGAS